MMHSEEVTEEIELVDDCLAAPTRAMVINFFGKPEESKSEGKAMSSLQLKD